MKPSLRLTVTLLAVLFLASCNAPVNPPTPDASLLSTIVAATFQALTPQVTQIPSETPTLTTFDTPTGLPATSTATSTATPTGTQAVTPTVSITPTPGIGALSGGIYGYPYGAIPALTFVAFNQETGRYWYWIIPAGLTYYSTEMFITGGRYQVVAYDAAGHAGGCITIVTVKNNETATCDITDWAGSYPSKPASVP